MKKYAIDVNFVVQANSDQEAWEIVSKMIGEMVKSDMKPECVSEEYYTDEPLEREE